MNRVTDDLIPRVAAIAAFDDKRVDRYYGDVSPESVIRIIESIPTVDAAPVVHGHWIDYKDNHQCSVCKKHTIYDTYVWKAIQFKFCPWCGAKMEIKNE